MRLATEVALRKRARAVSAFHKNAVDLRRRGGLLLSTEPFVDLLILPTRPMRLVVPIAGGPGNVQMDVANVVARPFVLRFDLDGYDQQPPSVTFHEPRSMTAIPFAAMPPIQERADGNEVRSIVVQSHPPFLCLPGVREYHTHPQHSGNKWCLYRADVTPYAIVERVLRALDANGPGVVLGLQACAVQHEAELR